MARRLPIGVFISASFQVDLGSSLIGRAVQGAIVKGSFENNKKTAHLLPGEQFVREELNPISKMIGTSLDSNAGALVS